MINSEGSLRSGFIMPRAVYMPQHYKSGAGVPPVTIHYSSFIIHSLNYSLILGIDCTE